MQQLMDRAEIEELYARYNWSVDQTDGHAFASTFTPDGAFIGTIGSFTGYEQLREFAEKQNLKQRGLQHWNANVSLAFDGADLVHGRAYMLVVCAGDPAPTIERAGLYIDEIVRSGGQWLFKSRRFSLLAGTG